MACFIVPAAEAVVTTVVKKRADKKAEGKEQNIFIRKMNLLNNMLWGGSALLAFEHVWHGEVTPWFPFLTAASSPAAAVEMLYEMAASGTAMAGVVTVVWACMVMAINSAEKSIAFVSKENIGREKL